MSEARKARLEALDRKSRLEAMVSQSWTTGLMAWLQLTTHRDVAELPVADLERLASELERVRDMCATVMKADRPSKGGVLAEMADGRGRD